MRLITSVFLLSLCLLPAVFGDAIPEVQSGEEGINDGIIDADGGGGGGDVISAEDFLQQAYRVEELQTEYHNDYKLVRCKSFPFLFLLFLTNRVKVEKEAMRGYVVDRG